MIVGVSLPFVQNLSGKTAMKACPARVSPVVVEARHPVINARGLSFDTGIAGEPAAGRPRAVELVWRTVGCFFL